MKQYKVTGVHREQLSTELGVALWFTDETSASLRPNAIQPVSPEERFARATVVQISAFMPPGMRTDHRTEYHVVMSEEEYEVAGKPTVGDYITIEIKKVAE